MQATPQNLVSWINDLTYLWQQAGLVLDSRAHGVFRKADDTLEVTWGNDGYVLHKEKFCSLSEYASLLENRQYSVLLSDGAILQFSFSVKRNKIIKHRLCWYPAPIDLESTDLELESITDKILEHMSNGDLEKFMPKSPIRFDYCEADATDKHPEVHMHMSVESCRIPVRTPLCLQKFLRFIVENFYPELPSDSPLITKIKSFPGKDTLTEYQKRKMHINIISDL